MTMNRQTHRRTLELGINAILFNEFRQKPEQWREAFKIGSTTRASFDDVAYTDFGPMEEGTELGGYSYDEGTEGPSTTYTPTIYQKAFKLSEEVLMDDQNGLMQQYPAAMGRSIHHTLETTHWTHFNNGFDSNYPGGDGKAFFASDHPLYGPGGGTQSNILATPANLSVTALEQAFIDISLLTDDRGKFIALSPKRLWHPVQLRFTAAKVLQTSGQVGTGNNDINTMQNAFPGGNRSVPYFTSTKAWFIECDMHFLKHFWRMKIRTGQTQDWDTDAYKHKAKGRWTSGWSTYLGWFGSQGVG